MQSNGIVMQKYLDHLWNSTWMIIMKFMRDQRRITDIACGDNHCLAIDDKYNVYSWGANYYAQLARNHKVYESDEPEYVERLKEYKIVKIQCGEQHCHARSDCGEHIFWGHNGYGQCLYPDDTETTHLWHPKKFDEFANNCMIARVLWSK